MRLLVIEDDPRLRAVLARGLEANGYFVDVAPSAEDALPMLTFTDYAVLIVDWRLPGMSGLEFVRNVRSGSLESAVLLLTARDAPDDRISGARSSADRTTPTGARCVAATSCSTHGPERPSRRAWHCT